MIQALTRVRRPTRLLSSVFSLLALLAGAGCDNTNPLATTAPADPTNQPPAVAGADSSAATEASVDPSFALYTTGTRFGAYGCTSSGFAAYNACIRAAGSWSKADLAAFKSKGARLILSQGGFAKFKNSDGTYSPTKYYNWVQSLKPYVSSWKPYVTDGTLLGAQLLDDRGAVNWGGKAITNAQIDQMAKWWKQILPGVTTFMSGGYTWMLTGYSWAYLDGSINQYNAGYMGDVKTWRDKSVAAAASARTSLILSMNVINGGKKFSGCKHYGTSSKCSMTPTEVRTYGAAIAAASGICGMGTWEYNTNYQAWSGVMDALKYVAGLAAKRSATSCKRR